MKNPLVSIVIPVYNGQKHLEQCLNSLLTQTLESIEIIVIDDGSTDNSAEIIKKYSENFENIKFIKQENQGVSTARAKGYKLASGKYIAWIDQDDIASNDMYEKMYNKAVSSDCDIVICNYKFYPTAVSNKDKWFNEFNGIIDWKFVNRNTLLWNKIIKKSYLNDIGFESLITKIGESSFLLLLLNTLKIDTINEELYSYRVGHNSLSSYSNMNWYIENLNGSIKRRDLIKNSHLAIKWVRYADSLAYQSYVQTMTVAAYNNNKTLYKKLRKELSRENRNKRSLINTLLLKNYGVKKFIFLRYISPNFFIATKYISRRYL